MDIRQAIQAAAQDPRFQQALQVAQSELSDASPEQVDELIQLLELALERPAEYNQIRAAAIADDMVEPDDLPEQFDATLIASVLVVLYKMREGGGEQVALARGGLSRVRTLARQGRMGDTMLAHISPEEAALLKARGGAGTINPQTGLPQYFSLKKLFKAVLPIALTFIAPGIGTAIGTALGATGTAAAMLGQAVIGGVTAGITGGNVLQGALLGGLTGGLGSAVGGAANNALGLGLGATGQSVLGGALVGGVAGAATGQGFGKGALMGAAGAGLGALGQGVGQGAIGAGIGAGTSMAGNMLAAGYKPKEALIGGGLSGLTAGMMYKPAEPFTGSGLKKPSDTVVEGLKAPQGTNAEFSRLGTTNYMTGEQGLVPGQAPQLVAPTTAAAGMDGALGSGLTAPQAGAVNPNLPAIQGAAPGAAAPGSNLLSLKNLGTMALLGSALQSAPPDVQQAVQTMSPEQQEYFNRPSVTWDWNKLQRDANNANMPLSQFMAAYWPQVSSGAYNMAAPQTPPPGMAMGGAYAGGGPLQAVARLVRGGGSGRDDTINARLSDGEYVMDAETVAMLGDGSTDEGARRLDAMRAQLRKHKGKTLARGKFSPNAKSPLAYLKGSAK